MRRSPSASLAMEVARAAQRRGAARLLVLDVDGTLAPIAPTPGEARVPKATLDALHGLVRLGWSIVVVSGRPAEEARRMVPVPGVRVFGSHGLERPRARGRHVALAPRIRRRLALLAAAGARLASGIDGACVESKPAGVAFHDRTIPRPGLARWRRGVRELLAASDLAGLEVIRGHRVVEACPRGRNGCPRAHIGGATCPPPGTPVTPPRARVDASRRRHRDRGHGIRTSETGGAALSARL